MRNAFVSYAHRLDQDAADDFIEIFGKERSVFSDRSLSGDLGDLADSTIKDSYIRPKIRNSSVTIVLIGAETSKRWWIDWEIYYSLLKTTGNDRNGILGIRIPYKTQNIPSRMLKNLHMCEIIDWPRDKRTLDAAIERVYNLRDQQPDLSDTLRVRNS